MRLFFGKVSAVALTTLLGGITPSAQAMMAERGEDLRFIKKMKEDADNRAKNSVYIKELSSNETKLTIQGEIDRNDIQQLCLSLEKNSRLEKLVLKENNFNRNDFTQILKALIENKSTNIKELFFDENPLSDEGVKQIGQLIEKNKSLIFLKLNFDNGIDKNTKEIFFKTLRKNRTITSLTLCGKIDDVCVIEIFKTITHPHESLRRLDFHTDIVDTYPYNTGYTDTTEKTIENDYLAPMYHNYTLISFEGCTNFKSDTIKNKIQRIIDRNKTLPKINFSKTYSSYLDALFN